MFKKETHEFKISSVWILHYPDLGTSHGSQAEAKFTTSLTLTVVYGGYIELLHGLYKRGQPCFSTLIFCYQL